MTTTQDLGSIKHTRTIDGPEDGEGDWAIYCSCRTWHAVRLASRRECDQVMSVHLDAVADCSWEIEQIRLRKAADLREPLNEAIRAEFAAAEDLRSRQFEYIIAKQHGAADDELEQLRLAIRDARDRQFQAVQEKVRQEVAFQYAYSQAGIQA